jgi:hypothetical protein
MQQCSIKTEHKKRNEEQKRWPREHRQQKVYEDMCSRINVGACSTITLHEVISTDTALLHDLFCITPRTYNTMLICIYASNTTGVL